VVGVILILYGTPQKIVQRGQIAAAMRPVDIAVSADYAIFKRTAQKIDCDVGCVAKRSADFGERWRGREGRASAIAGI